MCGFQAKTIVAPVDFSDQSFPALDKALDIADSPSDVHVVHVIPESEVAEADVIWRQIDDSTRRQRAFDKLHKQFSDDKYAQVQIHVEVGNPCKRVPDFAKEISADLIVMPWNLLPQGTYLMNFADGMCVSYSLARWIRIVATAKYSPPSTKDRNVICLNCCDTCSGF